MREPARPAELRPTGVTMGLFCLSAAMLIYQVTLTRIFSVAQFYHFAFMIISLAMLGFGARGTVLALFPRLGRRRPVRTLAALALGYGAAGVGAYALTNLLLAVVAVGVLDVDVLVARRLEARTRLLGELLDDLDGVNFHLLGLREHRRLVTGARPDLQHPLPRLELQQLRHLRHDEGLRDGLTVADGQGVVGVGLVAIALRGNDVARDDDVLHHRQTLLSVGILPDGGQRHLGRRRGMQRAAPPHRRSPPPTTATQRANER